MGRKVSDFCEVNEEGELYCEFPENKHDEEPENIDAPEISRDEVRVKQGDAPERDIDVI